MTIPMDSARRRLARLWFLAAAGLLVLMLAASINRDEGTIKALWSWFLPAIIPTLSLIIGVLIAEHLGKSSARREADKFLLGLATWLSVAYQSLLAISLVFDQIDWIALASSQLYLAPLQGLVATALSAFFTQKDASTDRNRRATDSPQHGQLAPNA